jgi:hypothetical protein
MPSERPFGIIPSDADGIFIRARHSVLSHDGTDYIIMYLDTALVYECLSVSRYSPNQIRRTHPQL